MSERQARRERMLRYFAQPYVQAIERARQAGAIPAIPGTVSVLRVAHDGDCPRLHGGLCRCQPDIELRWEPASTGVVA